MFHWNVSLLIQSPKTARNEGDRTWFDQCKTVTAIKNTDFNETLNAPSYVDANPE